MTKKTSLLATLIVLLLGIGMEANAIDRQSLVRYASSLKGKKGASLKSALMPLLKPQQVLSYGSGSGHTWDGFYQTDRNTSTNECYNRYSSKKFYFEKGNRNRAISGMNIEHSFPKSWWGGASNNAYKDLYNLYPSDSKANSSKNNYPMDEVTNGQGEEGYDQVGTGVHTSKAWEPGDQFKGDFARSYMYMAIAYADLTFSGTGLQTMNNEDYPGLKPWASTLYIKWGKQDSISTLELARNNAVAKIEGNRNLLIDYPHLAEYVWGDSANVAFDPSTSVTTADDDDRYWTGTVPVVPDKPDTPDDVYYFSAANNVTPGKLYLIVANENGTLHAMMPLGSSQNYGYPKVTTVNAVNDTITLSSTDNAFTIDAQNGGYVIIDKNKRYLWHDGTYKTLSVSSNPNDADVWTITANADGSFKILTDATYFIQYSKGYTSFGCYNGQQSDGIMPMLYEQVEKSVTPDAIKNIERTETFGDGAVYTIQGQFVGKSLDNLPRGLYIRNGKKIVVR